MHGLRLENEKINVEQGVQGNVDKNWQSQNLSPSFNIKKNQLVYILMMMIIMTTTTCMYMMWWGTHISQHMCGSQRTTFGSCFSHSTIKGFKWSDSDLQTSWQALLHTKPWTPFCLTLGSVPLTSVPSTCKAMMLWVSSPSAESGSSWTLLCWWILLMPLPLPSSHMGNGKRTATSLNAGKKSDSEIL